MIDAAAYILPGIVPTLESELVFLCDRLGVTMDWITRRTNKREVVDVRKLIAYILMSKGFASVDIARKLNVDHATVLYYNKKVQERMDIYRYYREQVMELMETKKVK
jgi:chromosomal replication initiation ATPase DnaA